jgi:hypothetical protein
MIDEVQDHGSATPIFDPEVFESGILVSKSLILSAGDCDTDFQTIC